MPRAKIAMAQMSPLTVPTHQDSPATQSNHVSSSTIGASIRMLVSSTGTLFMITSPFFPSHCSLQKEKQFACQREANRFPHSRNNARVTKKKKIEHSNGNLAPRNKTGRRGERTPLEAEAKAKMMLAQGYTVAGTARQLGLARNTVQGINQRLTSKERDEWSQQYRTWAEQELLLQLKEYFMEALPSAKPWGLNNIIGTAFDKLQALEGRPTEIHAHLHTHTQEIHDLGQRFRDALAIQEGTLSSGQESAENGPSG